MDLTITPSTQYEVECWRDGKLLWVEKFHNLVTTVGKNGILDITFKNGGAANAWYVGLVDNASFSAYAVGDTMGSHAGWVESQAYGEATRVAYVPAVASAGTMTNTASKAEFTMNATKTIRGAFLVNQSTKGGTTGTLYGIGDFAVSRSVISGDILFVRITLTVS
jgi:hypothetical protein